MRRQRSGFTLAEILLSLGLLALVLCTAIGVLQWALQGTLQHQEKTSEAFLAQAKLEELVLQSFPENGEGLFPNPQYRWSSQVKPDPQSGALNLTVTVKGPAGASFQLSSQRRASLRTIVFRSGTTLYEGDEDSRQFVPLSTASGIGQISLSPDGRTLAFVALFQADLQIYTCPLDGSAPATLLFQCPGGAQEPSYSPNGEQLAFVNQAAGESHICIYSLKEKTWLTRSRGARDTSPAWCPDNRTLVYSRNHSSLILDSGDSSRTLVADGSGWNDTPTVGPDGTIVFMSSRSGNPDIFSIDPRTSQTRQLTDDPAFDECPRYSKDSRRILFLSYRSGQARLYTMNPDGTQVLGLAPSFVASDPLWLR